MALKEAMAEQRILATLGLTSHECEGSVFHSPTPLGTHAMRTNEIFPGGSTGRARTIYLCGTCLENLRVYLVLCTTSNGALPWDVRRDFGNVIRRIGQEIWSTHYEESRG